MTKFIKVTQILIKKYCDEIRTNTQTELIQRTLHSRSTETLREAMTSSIIRFSNLLIRSTKNVLY